MSIQMRDVDVWATNSTAIEANQTLLRVLCYMPAGGNEAIQGLCKLLAEMADQFLVGRRGVEFYWQEACSSTS